MTLACGLPDHWQAVRTWWCSHGSTTPLPRAVGPPAGASYSARPICCSYSPAVPRSLSVGSGLAAPAGPGPDPARSSEVVPGSALVGCVVRFRWPTKGWVGGTVIRLSQAAARGFSLMISALGANRLRGGCGLTPRGRFTWYCEPMGAALSNAVALWL